MSNSVSLCMIVKNEQANIGKLLDNVCPHLEEVVIVDTGSTDATISILSEAQKKYINLRLEHFEWIDDFSAARNYSFSFAQHDWIFWLDGDDQINPQELKRFKDTTLNEPGVDVWMLDYIYSQFSDGSPQTVLGRERFIRRSKNPKWVGRIHETVDISGMRDRYSEFPKIVHNRIGKVIDYDRNIRLLAKEFEDKPNDPRTAYYYGKELFDRVDPKGVEILERYLKLGGKYYDDEVNARSRIARHYLAQKRFRDAIKVIEPIYHLDGTRRRAEYYWTFGQVEQNLGNYDVAIKFYEMCLLPAPPKPRVLSMEYYTWNPCRRIAECYIAKSNYVEAFKWADRVKAFLPTDEEVSNWYNSLCSIEVQPINGLKVVEIVKSVNQKVRNDSYTVSIEDCASNYKAGYKLPFKDQNLDGIVIHTNSISWDEISRVLRPVGFCWIESEVNTIPNEDIQLLHKNVQYKGKKFDNYIRIDPLKEKFAFQSGDLVFGPYRIRIQNLKLSAIKSGFPIVDTAADFYIATALQGQEQKGKIKILEMCELLDNYSNGVEHADVVNCSSQTLADYLKKRYPDKHVINVDDHFEMTPEEWL